MLGVGMIAMLACAGTLDPSPEQPLDDDELRKKNRDEPYMRKGHPPELETEEELMARPAIKPNTVKPRTMPGGYTSTPRYQALPRDEMAAVVAASDKRARKRAKRLKERDGG